MKVIKLKNSPKTLIVDDVDYERCRLIKWYLGTRGVYSTENNNHVSVSNFIMLNELQYDHKDRNFLNNQRKNLRLCNDSQNNCNKEKYPKSAASKYKGVNPRGDGWQVRIQVNGKRVQIGTFKSEKRAAIEYNRAAIFYHKEFAVLNQIN